MQHVYLYIIFHKQLTTSLKDSNIMESEFTRTSQLPLSTEDVFTVVDTIYSGSSTCITRARYIKILFFFIITNKIYSSSFIGVGMISTLLRAISSCCTTRKSYTSISRSTPLGCQSTVTMSSVTLTSKGIVCFYFQ